MNIISAQSNGTAYITRTSDNLFLQLTIDDVRQIAENYELYCTVEDVNFYLTENDEKDEGGDYDYEKYPPHVVERLAREVMERKSDSANIQETSAFIIEWTVDDYKEGKVTAE